MALERMQLPEEILNLLKANGDTSKTQSSESSEKWTLKGDLVRKAQMFNATEIGTLTGVDCQRCKNRGFTYYVDDSGLSPSLRTKPCECMEKRKSIRRIEQSGLKDLLQRYTFETWQMPDRWQSSARELAQEYVDKRDGWFMAAGQSGAGKTHICTAICAELLNAGLPVRYVLWRDMSVRAKAAVTDGEEYEAITEPLKRIKVLYIDDLFKTGKGKEPTPGDVNLAFEILNYRYNDSEKLTIISTERTREELLDIDEATASRISERAKSYWLSFYDKPNWRLK